MLDAIDFLAMLTLALVWLIHVARNLVCLVVQVMLFVWEQFYLDLNRPLQLAVLEAVAVHVVVPVLIVVVLVLQLFVYHLKRQCVDFVELVDLQCLHYSQWWDDFGQQLLLHLLLVAHVALELVVILI